MDLLRSKKRSRSHTRKARSHTSRQSLILRRDDCEAIVRLMEHGFSLGDAMGILEEKNNSKIFDSITRKLAQGESIAAFFPLYCPKSYRVYFEGFIRYMPFIESLSSSIAIVKTEEKNKQEIIRGMLYPVLLMIGMTIGIGLFNAFILPNMISLLAGFDMDTKSYELLQMLVAFITKFLMITFICISLLVCFALQKKQVAKTYRLISQIFPNSILVQYASSQFARFYLECEKRNVSTIETMRILKEIKEKPLVCYIAEQMDIHLLKGESLDAAIQKSHVEKALLKFFKIALYASDSEKMLQGYLDMVHFRTLLYIKRFSRNIQLISYSAIGTVLIFVYRILMMPMRMLQTL